jgi:leader peptidase (prepilin peptidase)/N-methyltransferase
MWIASALALLTAALSFSLLDPLTALISCAFGGAMLAIAVSDMRHFIVPDILSLPAVPIGLIVSGWLAREGEPIVLWHTAAALAGAAALYAIGEGYQWARSRQGLGLGDVKLAAVAGAWVGPEGLIQVLLVACAAALTYVIAIGLLDLQKPNATSAIPLGAFLAPAIWIVWFVAQTFSA